MTIGFRFEGRGIEVREGDRASTEEVAEVIEEGVGSRLLKVEFVGEEGYGLLAV